MMPKANPLDVVGLHRRSLGKVTCKADNAGLRKNDSSRRRLATYRDSYKIPILEYQSIFLTQTLFTPHPSASTNR